MASRSTDPCRVRYGLWRAHALAMAVAGPIHGGLVGRVLANWDVPVVPGTLQPALLQMVDAGMFEPAPELGAGGEKPLLITQRGRQEVAEVRRYLVHLMDLIDRKPQAGQPGAPTRTRSPERSDGVLAALVAVARESEASVARLREALRQMKLVVDAALAPGR